MVQREVICEWCHAPFELNVRGRPKTYCCDDHRLKAWTARRQPEVKPPPKRRADIGVGPRLRQHLPAKPLLDALASAGFVAQIPIGKAADLDERFIGRARERGSLPLWAIDQIAVKVLNVHPSVIYGDVWFDDTARFEKPGEVSCPPKRNRGRPKVYPTITTTSVLDLPWSVLSKRPDDPLLARQGRLHYRFGYAAA